MTERAAPAGPPVSVTVIEEETVLRGGAATVAWLVRQNDGWVRAQRHPSARSEQLERGSGVVWRTRVTLSLARGTALTRVETRPAPRQKSALDHLTGAARGAEKKTTRTEYVVAESGDLVATQGDRPTK